MPDDFLDPILERIAREQRTGMRIGTVTAIDATNAALTVSLAGDVVSGVRWVGSYTPTVADVVVISRVDAMWVVLGKLSKQLGGATVRYDAYTILPYGSYYTMNAGATWQATNYGYPAIPQEGWAGTFRSAGIVTYPGLGSPMGATILSAKVRITRAPTALDAGADLVNPVIYGHAYPTSTTPSGAPAWVAGYGPWRPGTLGIGMSATWDLPSTWLTALAAGTITGLGVYTTAAEDNAAFMVEGLSWSLQVNYSIPI